MGRTGLSVPAPELMTVQLGTRVPSFHGSFGFGNLALQPGKLGPVPAVLAGGQVPALLAAAPTLVLG